MGWFSSKSDSPPRSGSAPASCCFGLGLFFSDQLDAFASSRESYLIGSGFIVAAALSWATYALCQKQPAREARRPRRSSSSSSGSPPSSSRPSSIGPCSQGSTRGIGLPWRTAASTPSRRTARSPRRWWHVEASRVSAVLAVNPLLTLASVAIAHAAFPNAFPEAFVSALGITGAFVAVGGSMLTTLTRR